MGSGSHHTDTFPFLSLPRELQAEVARHVGDILALRDLLAIPQVARSVAPFLRLVTNGKEPLWFCGLEKHVTHTVAPHGLPKGVKNRDGPIYLLDLDESQNLDPTPYRHLWNPIVVFTVGDDSEIGGNYRQSRSIFRFTSITDARTVGIIGTSGSTCIDITPKLEQDMLIAINLTLVNIDSVTARPICDPLERTDVRLPPIRVVGGLSSLQFEDFPSMEDYDAESRVVHDRYKEMIGSARDLDFYADQYFDGHGGGDLVFGDWDIPQVTDLCRIHRCLEVFNLNINTAYTDDTAYLLKDGELSLEFDTCVRENEPYRAPEIRHLVAPGLRNLIIHTRGPFFLRLKSLWFPHLETLRLTGINDMEVSAIRFDHLDILELEEASKLLLSVKDLHLDQFILPILGFVAPFSLENVTKLTLDEHETDDLYGIELEEMGILKMRHGKMHLPKLKQIRWCSSICNEEKVLDFAQLSKWFTFPRLKILLFDTCNETVSLKDIAHQTPRIKVLKITRPNTDTYTNISPLVYPGIYPTPDLHLPLNPSFERLETLVVHTGYHKSMFSGILFPHLKSLDVHIALRTERSAKVEASMPVLEEMFITATSESDALMYYLFISDFKNLRKLVLNSDVENLLFHEPMPHLEEITHTGNGLKEMRGRGELFESLKTLRYTSLSGEPCHTFVVGGSVDVRVR